MKMLTLAATLVLSSMSVAQATVVCYGNHGNDCHDMNYKYSAPHMERVCQKEGHHDVCYNRLTVTNYGPGDGTFDGSHGNGNGGFNGGSREGGKN